MSGLAVATLAYPITTGVLQGFQRFGAVAGMIVAPFALRIVVLDRGHLGRVAPRRRRLRRSGRRDRSNGDLAIWLVKEPIARGARVTARPTSAVPRYLWPVFVGLSDRCAHDVDLLVVRARFSGRRRRVRRRFCFARIAFFLPATILAVVFPRTAARQARGEDTRTSSAARSS